MTLRITNLTTLKIWVELQSDSTHVHPRPGLILCILSEMLLSLLRHYSLGLGRWLRVLYEYSVGLLKFVLWVPRLSKKLHLLLSGPTDSKYEDSIPNLALSPLDARFINLESRKDRLILIESELDKLAFVKKERFIGVKDANGSLGCARSHVTVLTQFLESDDETLMVCEDDLEFVGSSSQVELAIQEFLDNPALDVLCLSYRLRGPKVPVSSMLSIGNNIQTTACYVVKRSAAAELLANFVESEALLSSGADPTRASIDVRWKILQMDRLVFAVPRRILARQRESYSDIVGKVKLYRP